MNTFKNFLWNRIFNTLFYPVKWSFGTKYLNSCQKWARCIPFKRSTLMENKIFIIMKTQNVTNKIRYDTIRKPSTYCDFCCDTMYGMKGNKINNQSIWYFISWSIIFQNCKQTWWPSSKAITKSHRIANQVRKFVLLSESEEPSFLSIESSMEFQMKRVT